MNSFDYRSASQQEILDLAHELPGLVLGDIPGANFSAKEARRGKGEAGAAIEAYFGIPPNSVQGADFIGAGIELKAVPLVQKQNGLRVKERTFISMIDYRQLASESWLTASVRKKLHILFVFYEHLLERPKEEFPVTHMTLWAPAGEVEDQIRDDWGRVQDKVLAGLAHELTEADGRILGPCTKGADSTALRPQPFSAIPAKSRAFALKPAFTLALYLESRREPLVAQPRLAELSSPGRLLQAFRRFEGRTIDDVAGELESDPSTSKSYAANVVHRAVGAASPVRSEELDATLTVKTSRVGPDLYPYEAMSFPAFRHLELIEEDWEDSDLLSRIEHMLIVPVHAPRRSTPQGACVIGRPLFWEPSAEQLGAIEGEWTGFRDQIRAGNADTLPKESETVALHVRPHGKDATDRDRAPGGSSQIRKSFWLNKRFVQQILKEG